MDAALTAALADSDSDESEGRVTPTPEAAAVAALRANRALQAKCASVSAVHQSGAHLMSGGLAALIGQDNAATAPDTSEVKKAFSPRRVGTPSRSAVTSPSVQEKMAQVLLFCTCCCAFSLPWSHPCRVLTLAPVDACHLRPRPLMCV